jgi:large subunit ribosomal protein L11
MLLKKKIYLYVYSQKAESGPPLGTVLGNLGVNSVKFCKEFNEFCIDIPNYLKLSVEIDIFENNSFEFLIKGLPLGFLISLLKFELENGF